MNYTRANEIIANSDSFIEILNILSEEKAEKEWEGYCNHHYWMKKARVRNLPISGGFELTPICNFDCKMCYVHLSPEQMHGKKLLTADEWESLMQQAIDEGMMYALITGGECLTYPEFDRLYLFLINHGVSTTVFTNGFLLDEKRIEFFCKYRPEEIQVTLYGHNNDCYEAVTGKRAFDTVISNVLNAKAAGLPIKIAITPSRYLGDKAEELIRYVNTLDIPFKLNTGLFEPQEDTERGGKSHDISWQDYIKLDKLMLELKSEIPPAECNSIPDVRKGAGKKRKGVPCNAGRCAFGISWKGELSACNSLPIYADSPLQAGFKAAWEQINKGALEYPLPTECDGCSYEAAALSCVGYHYPDAEPGHASEKVCERCREYMKSGLIKIEKDK